MVQCFLQGRTRMSADVNLQLGLYNVLARKGNVERTIIQFVSFTNHIEYAMTFPELKTALANGEWVSVQLVKMEKLEDEQDGKH